MKTTKHSSLLMNLKTDPNVGLVNFGGRLANFLRRMIMRYSNYEFDEKRVHDAWGSWKKTSGDLEGGAA